MTDFILDEMNKHNADGVDFVSIFLIVYLDQRYIVLIPKKNGLLPIEVIPGLVVAIGI